MTGWFEVGGRLNSEVFLPVSGEIRVENDQLNRSESLATRSFDLRGFPFPVRVSVGGVTIRPVVCDGERPKRGEGEVEVGK